MLRYRFCSLLISLVIFEFIGHQALWSMEKAFENEQAYISRLQSERNKQFPREFKSLLLKNGLEVLIIQDPRATQKASVSMSVASGLWSDPPAYRGMAHYMEHMLFLGTAKYPDGKEYSQFIDQNGGSNNAYTSVDHTNYYFEVNVSALEEALDRFGHFFVDPTFNQTLIPNEMLNVNSEYEKNKKDNDRRFHHVGRILSNPEHPNAYAFQGNQVTLGSVSKEVLDNYYSRHYSADKMKLAIISSLPVDQIASWISLLYEQIPVSSVEESKTVIPIYREQDFARLIEIKPEGDAYRSLKIVFLMPPWINYLYSSPHALLSELLNRTDPGSLSDNLKSEGLINTLRASFHDFHSQALMEITFKLSDQGRLHWKEVVQKLFEYITLLKKIGLTKEYFGEAQTLAEWDFKVKTPSTADEGAVDWANYMRHIPWFEIEAMKDLLVRYDASSFQDLLALMTPKRMQVFLSSQNLMADHDNALSDEFFEAVYKVSPLNQEDLEIWSRAEIDECMSYPPSNAYIPSCLDMRGQTLLEPKLVRNDEKMSLWVQTDHTFNKPSVEMTIEILEAKQDTLPEYALKKLYFLALAKSNAKWIKLADKAGLEGELSQSDRGYKLIFKGYSDKFIVFAKDYIRKLKQIELSDIEFNTLKEEIKIQLKNLKFTKKAYELGAERLRVLIDPRAYPVEELLEVIEKLTLDDVHAFSNSLFNKIYVRAYAFGNILEEEAQVIIEELYNEHGAEAMDAHLRPCFECVKLPKGAPAFHKIKVAGNNHAWWLKHQFGSATPELYAILKIGESILGTSFYDEMRTQQSIGYIVKAYSYQTEISGGFNFVMQTERPLPEVTKIAEDWIKKAADLIEATSAEDFLKLKEALIEAIILENSTFEEKAKFFTEAILWMQEDLAWKQKRIEALMKITQEEVVAKFRKSFSPETNRKLTVFVEADDGTQAEIIRPLESEITDIQIFKNSVDRYRR